MSFKDVLAELPALTVSQRQVLIRHALELDESPLSSEEETVVEQRLEAHRENPGEAVSLDEMKVRLRARFPA